MTRLELCQRTRSECGLGGSGPSTTIGQTGEALQIVRWVDSAWQRIQSSRNWDWLWEAASVTVLNATSTTSGEIPAARWVKDSVRNPDGVELSYLPWDSFRLAFPAALIAAGAPSVWTIRPDKAFAVNAKPSSNTLFSCERFKNPTAMEADDDVPTGLPAEHCMIIVWRAVMFYAGHDEAGELYQHANAEYKKVLAAMCVTETPEIEFGCSW